MTLDEIKNILRSTLSAKRYVHSVNVMQVSIELAQRYGEDAGIAAAAGLLHDCARDIGKAETLELCARYDIITDEITKRQPELLHGQLGAHVARERYGITDSRVLDAIACHTMGKRDMNLLDRIVFVAEYIEPARIFPGVEAIRKAALQNLERAMILGIDNTIGYLLQKGALIHPETVNTRNWVIQKFKA